jgi:pimeloyl-ACP methyl ester carboxylesterase
MDIVLVHGYLAHAAIFWPLARRLRRLGHRPHLHRYPSALGTLDAHAASLADLMEAVGGPLAVLGHSLGGLVVHRAMAQHPELPISHRIFVSTPHRGSRVARASRRSLVAPILSSAVKVAAQGHVVPASLARTGAVVGTRDKMISASEAELPEADDRLALPYGHNEILLRPDLARAVDHFLRHGCFEAGLNAGAAQRP